MAIKPRLADVSCKRIQFQPGDRILVRVYHELSKEQKRIIRKMIEKWAGVSLEILIYNATQMEIYVQKGEKVGLLQQ